MKRIKKSKDIWQQLKELKAVTELTGTIHDAQVFQLKLWAELVFDFADDVEIAVGLPYLSEDGQTAVDLHRVEYRVKATDKPPKDLKKRLGGLDRSVKSLLGDYFELVVKANSASIFISKGSRRKRATFKQIEDRVKRNDLAERAAKNAGGLARLHPGSGVGFSR